jgi:hypothetical protein
VCAVVLVFVARAAFRRNAAEPPPARAAAAQHERVPAPAPVAADGELGEELPPDHEWGIPPPTAPWMTAPADPIVVSVTPGRRQNEVEITPGGGKIEVANERATFTLFIPRGALLENQEITLTVVDQIANLPFAGGVASAVQIAPAHALFLLPVGLTIEPRRRTPADAKQRAAGFSVRGDPAELHLYPVRETTEVNRSVGILNGRLAKGWAQCQPSRRVLSGPSGVSRQFYTLSVHDVQVRRGIQTPGQLGHCGHVGPRGPSGRLRISRLWGATNNRVRPCEEAHVVVATYQTLIRDYSVHPTVCGHE